MAAGRQDHHSKRSTGESSGEPKFVPGLYRIPRVRYLVADDLVKMCLNPVNVGLPYAPKMEAETGLNFHSMLASASFFPHESAYSFEARKAYKFSRCDLMPIKLVPQS